jgi:hypothetical protein
VRALLDDTHPTIASLAGDLASAQPPELLAWQLGRRAAIRLSSLLDLRLE